MQHFTLILESPMVENMVDTLKRIYASDETEEDDLELECDMKNMLCQNDALMASLPY